MSGAELALRFCLVFAVERDILLLAAVRFDCCVRHPLILPMVPLRLGRVRVSLACGVLVWRAPSELVSSARLPVFCFADTSSSFSFLLSRSPLSFPSIPSAVPCFLFDCCFSPSDFWGRQLLSVGLRPPRPRLAMLAQGKNPLCATYLCAGIEGLAGEVRFFVSLYCDEDSWLIWLA